MREFILVELYSDILKRKCEIVFIYVRHFLYLTENIGEREEKWQDLPGEGGEVVC